MKQFIFKVINQPGVEGNTNCKSTILIKAKDLDQAENKLNDMGFNLLDGTPKGNSKKLPVVSFSTFHTNRMLGEQMLEAPEDHGLI
jgi:hypothetical protein